MKLHESKEGYALEITDHDKAQIWIVLNEYRQYRLTSSEGEREMTQLFCNLLNNVPNPTEHLIENAKHLARIKSEHYGQRYKNK